MAKLDLNLLPALQSLLELRNVSRAAERMHLSQSSMSASLSRLRRHFGDDLLVREGRGYVLTPFAETLLPRVDHAMALLQDTLGLHEGFIPGESDRRFVVAASDYAIAVLLRPLRTLIRDGAPDIEVDFVPNGRDYTQPGLDTFTRVDLIIGPSGFDLPGESQTLFRDDFVALVDRQHPILDQDVISLSDLARCPQVVGGFGGNGITPSMRLLAEHGHAPHVAVRLSGLQSLPAVLPGTDLLTFVPRRLASTALPTGDLVAIDLAVELEVPLVETVRWHPLRHDDPGNSWLRGVLQQAAEALPIPECPVHPVEVRAMDEGTIGPVDS